MKRVASCNTVFFSSRVKITTHIVQRWLGVSDRHTFNRGQTAVSGSGAEEHCTRRTKHHSSAEILQLLTQNCHYIFHFWHRFRFENPSSYHIFSFFIYCQLFPFFLILLVPEWTIFFWVVPWILFLWIISTSFPVACASSIHSLYMAKPFYQPTNSGFQLLL